jgi:hypothetical protein
MEGLYTECLFRPAEVMAKDDFAFFFFFHLLTCNVTYLSPIRFTLYIMITRTDTLKKCMVKHYSLGQNCQLQQYNFFKDLTPLNRFHMGFLLNLP